MKFLKLFKENFYEKTNPKYWIRIGYEDYIESGVNVNMGVHTSSGVYSDFDNFDDREKRIICGVLGIKNYHIVDNKKYKISFISKSPSSSWPSIAKSPYKVVVFKLLDSYFLVRYIQWESNLNDYVSYFYKCDQIDGLINLLEILPDAK
jgi:hypothetical protein